MPIKEKARDCTFKTIHYSRKIGNELSETRKIKKNRPETDALQDFTSSLYLKKFHVSRLSTKKNGNNTLILSAFLVFALQSKWTTNPHCSIEENNRELTAKNLRKICYIKSNTLHETY